MKFIGICWLVLVWSAAPAWGTDYFFLAQEDHYYANPANWYPAYPGHQIGPEDRVFLLTDVYYRGFTLEVAGTLEVELGAEIISADGGIRILPTGLLDNDGTLMVRDITNQGRLHNRLSAVIHVHRYRALPASHTHNACAATFVALDHLVNEGQFDNYAHCEAGRSFYNLAVFNQLSQSRLDVRGELVLAPESTLRQAQGSRIYQRYASGWQPVHDRLDDFYP